MVTRHKTRFLLLWFVVLLVPACGASSTDGAILAPWPTAGWSTSAPEAQGVDSERLARMLAVIDEGNYAIDAVLVVRHGYLVVEAYKGSQQPEDKHIVYSCTKSVVSALVGITIDRGDIDGVDQPLLSFFPGRPVANVDARKEAMTLEHVLTMTTGLDCRDSYLYRWKGLREMEGSDDWVQHVLDLPMVEEPGQKFEYCNGASYLLSAIVQETTGLSARAFAQEVLFGPLGIEDLRWFSSPQGVTIGWSDLHLRPRDMAKIGYLYLRGGQWDGEQLVSSAWVEASSRKHIPATLQDGYGYQWWVRDDGIYMALGYEGQFIYVVPDKDMVVVFASALPESDFYVPQELLDGYVLPAARSTGPLPENPAGLAQLQSQIEALAGH
jgi:CubicO group peptidase (beta-lactamase class C family)